MSLEFSFPRLIQLIRRQWIEHSTLFIYSIIAIVAINALLLWFWTLSVDSVYMEETTYFMFIIGLYVCGFVYASLSFNALSDKAKATYWLSTPASHFEKLLAVIFYTSIMFVIIYCVSFFLIRGFAVSYIKDLVLTNPKKYTFYPVEWTTSFKQVFTAFMFGFVAIQAFYVLGSAYFSRYSFVLTTIVGAVIIGVFIYYTAKLSIAFFGKEYSWQGIVVKAAESDERYHRVYELSPFIVGLLIFIAKYIWAPIFWVATWFRLKEKQV